jgi:UDP-glucose 4-epimerase
MAYQKSYSIPVSIFRFFNVFGPWQRPDHVYSAVIPKWIMLATQNKQISIHGNGSQTRDFTYVGSLIDILSLEISNNLGFTGVVNLAHGHRVSLNQLVSLIASEFPNLKFKYDGIRQGDVQDSQNDPTLLNSKYPNIQPISFEDGLLKTINWYREFGEKFFDYINVIN